MSEEKNTSQVNNKRTKKHRKNHFAVLPYIFTPIIFVLISLVVVIPVGNRMMNMAVDTVHKAQKTLCVDFNDVQAKDNYSGVSSGNSENKPKDVSKFGEIRCESAGLKADAYYGINRVSLRNGAAISSESALPGEDGVVNAYGYASTAFKALKNVEVGDSITFETSWGEYNYRVTEVIISAKVPDCADKGFVLASSKDDSSFSCFDDEKLYVVAELISAASAEEVQQ